MISALIYRVSDGHIRGVYVLQVIDHLEYQVGDGESAIIVPPGFDAAGKYVSGGEILDQDDLGETKLTALVGAVVMPPDLPQIPDTLDTSEAGIQTWEFSGPYMGRFCLEVISIETARARAWEAVKAARDAHESGGAASPLGVVDSDPVSIGRITGAVVMAQVALGAGAPFTIDWTMADNSTETHDAAAMIAMGVAVGAHVDAVHAHARTLRGEIEAATTLEALAAIDFEGGWPAY